MPGTVLDSRIKYNQPPLKSLVGVTDLQQRHPRINVKLQVAASAGKERSKAAREDGEGAGIESRSWGNDTRDENESG